MKNIPAVFTVIRVVASIALLYVVWQHVHWSVALVLTLQGFAIEGIAAAIKLHSKIVRAQERGIQAAMQSFDRQSEQFSQFVGSINRQAEAVKKEMNICRECEIHGMHGIRPGSLHNKNAANCLLKPKEKI